MFLAEVLRAKTAGGDKPVYNTQNCSPVEGRISQKYLSRFRP
jgi:hypothetical protein